MKRNSTVLRVVVVLCLLSVAGIKTIAQKNEELDRANPEVARSERPLATDAERISALEESIRQQAAQLAELRKLLKEQQATLTLLAGRLSTSTVASASATAGSVTGTSTENPTADRATASEQPQVVPIENRVRAVEDRVAKIGPFKFSGDFRLRYDGIFRSASEPPDPPLTHSQNSRAFTCLPGWRARK